jgi:hypothetical protein
MVTRTEREREREIERERERERESDCDCPLGLLDYWVVPPHSGRALPHLWN